MRYSWYTKHCPIWLRQQLYNEIRKVEREEHKKKSKTPYRNWVQRCKEIVHQLYSTYYIQQLSHWLALLWNNYVTYIRAYRGKDPYVEKIVAPTKVFLWVPEMAHNKMGWLMSMAYHGPKVFYPSGRYRTWVSSRPWISNRPMDSTHTICIYRDQEIKKQKLEP